MDLGSKAIKGSSSSYLGELEVLKWSLSTTHGMRGDMRTIVRCDNKGVVDAWRSPLLVFNDVRIARRWGWIIANEPYIEIIYIPGEDNIVADLLSRPSEGICRVTMRPAINDDEGKNDIVGIENDTMLVMNDKKVNNKRRKGQKGSSTEDVIWEEHCRGHYGPDKVYQMLNLVGRQVTV